MRYSRTIWCPRRATFSVRIERRISSTVTACAVPQAAISGSSIWVLPVSSTAKKVAVSGERMVPPITAAIASSAQKPGLPHGIYPPSSVPMAPPMISSGASTPPEVPEPSATDQITAFTTSSGAAALTSIWPCGICVILS